jgi:hypothetical protein
MVDTIVDLVRDCSRRLGRLVRSVEQIDGHLALLRGAANGSEPLRGDHSKSRRFRCWHQNRGSFPPPSNDPVFQQDARNTSIPTGCRRT